MYFNFIILCILEFHVETKYYGTALGVCTLVNAYLQPRLDAAIDRIKRDGRFDRINTKYLPFRLQ